MKRETREWLRATSYSLTLTGQYADEVREELARQRAQIRDLKARLAEALDRLPLSWRDPVITACFDLKNKNWRKP